MIGFLLMTGRLSESRKTPQPRRRRYNFLGVCVRPGVDDLYIYIYAALFAQPSVSHSSFVILASPGSVGSVPFIHLFRTDRFKKAEGTEHPPPPTPRRFRLRFRLIYIHTVYMRA